MKKNTRVIVLAVAASIYILYNFIVTSFIVARMPDRPFELGNIFFAEVIVFIPVGVFFIVVQRLYRKQRWLFTTFDTKTVSIHILLLVLLIAVHSVWQVYFNSLLIGATFILDTVIRDIIGFLNLRVLIYIISIGLVVGIVKIKEKENSLLKQSELKLKLQRTSFRELELKLNPEVIYPNLHFIKNNLHEKPDETSRLVLNLSKQLRILIDNLDEERIPMEQDLRFYEYYFEALQLRLGRTLTVQQDVLAEHMDVEIPSMVLMVPFLEALFFGNYAEFTRTVHHVSYQSEETDPGFIYLALHFHPVTKAEILGSRLIEDDHLAQIHRLLAGYEGSFLRSSTVDDNLSITLKMEMD